MNSPALIATTFTDLSGHVSYGYRLYDNYGKTYCNMSSCLIEDDLELLQFAIREEDEFSETLFAFLSEEQQGLEINNEFYDFDLIKDVLKGL